MTKFICTILKTIIWYFFNAICFVFNATNIYFCIVVSFKKRLQTCTTWIEFSFHSVCLDVRPYYGDKIILNMQFSFCNYRQWWSSWWPAKKSPVILPALNCSYLPSQSAPTILVLKTWVGLWPWKKSGQKYGPEKSWLQ